MALIREVQECVFGIQRGRDKIDRMQQLQNEKGFWKVTIPNKLLSMSIGSTILLLVLCAQNLLQFTIKDTANNIVLFGHWSFDVVVHLLLATICCVYKLALCAWTVQEQIKTHQPLRRNPLSGVSQNSLSSPRANLAERRGNNRSTPDSRKKVN